MVPGREGDDAARLLIVGQSADAVVSAAKLEGSGALQAFCFHQNPPADHRVQSRAFEQGRADGDPVDLAGSVEDAFIAGQVRRHMLPLAQDAAGREP